MTSQAFLALMNAQMNVEIALVGEGFPTRGTCKRLFTSVCADVSKKQGLVLKLLATNIAIVRALLIAHGVNNLLRRSTRLEERRKKREKNRQNLEQKSQEQEAIF